MIIRILAFFCALLLAAPSLSAQDVLTQARWMRHLTEDLIPFWTTPDAIGDPVGMYPSMRCNDGAAFDADAPCAEIASLNWMTPDQKFIIALSRQAYAYLVMFHMTGERRYLDLGKAGVDVILNDARDGLGGTFEGFDTTTGAWWHEKGRFTIQKQAYALLAPAFYYYLTRDRTVFEEIEEIRQTIIALHRQDDGLYRWRRPGEAEAAKIRRYAITAYLDQLNAYYVLLAPIAPPGLRADWLAETESIAQLLRPLFLHEPSQMFHLTGAKVDGGNDRPNADMGHAAKSHWFLMMTGALANDDARIETSRSGGKKLLNASYTRKTGAWSNGFDRKGRPFRKRDAWVFAEQNQLLASLALSEPRLKGVLSKTYGYWLEKFVDRKHGGVFDALTAKGRPFRKRGRPKHWAWKSGFHEFEHALVAYITSSQFEGAPATLHFALSDTTAGHDLRPYFFNARLTSLEEVAEGVQAATFDRITFP